MPIQLTPEVLTIALGGSGVIGALVTKGFDYLGKRAQGDQDEFSKLVEMLRQQNENTGSNLGMLINHVLATVSTASEALDDVRTGLKECKAAHELCEQAHERCERDTEKLKQKVSELELRLNRSMQ